MMGTDGGVQLMPNATRPVLPPLEDESGGATESEGDTE